METATDNPGTTDWSVYRKDFPILDQQVHGHPLVYLDNAATVYPKPPEILDAALELFKRYGVNPGRSGYDLCLVGGELVQQTREELTRFFGGEDFDTLVAPGEQLFRECLEHGVHVGIGGVESGNAGMLPQWGFADAGF